MQNMFDILIIMEWRSRMFHLAVVTPLFAFTQRRPVFDLSFRFPNQSTRHTKRPQNRIMQPFSFPPDPPSYRGRPLSAPADSPLCGYAATEVGKAEQEVPPGSRNPIVRVHAAQAGIRPVVQIPEPEPFPQPRRSYPGVQCIAVPG